MMRKYNSFVIDFHNKKNDFTPIKVEKLLFLCQMQLIKEKRKKIIPYKIYWKRDGGVEIPYISRLLRVIPLFSRTNRYDRIFLRGLTLHQLKIIKNLLSLTEDELERLYSLNLIEMEKKQNSYSKMRYKLWLINARITALREVSISRFIFFFFQSLLLSLFLVFTIFLLILSLFTEKDLFTESFIVLCVIQAAVLLHFLLKTTAFLREETVYESGILGNNDNKSISYKEYIQKVKKLKKDKIIGKNRI